MQELLEPILRAFDKAGITDTFLKRSIVANMQKECGLIPQEENLNYCRTDNTRIRSIFGNRVTGLSDAQLNDLKCDKKKFANHIYGSTNSVGRSMGNMNPDDGWTYRGRGYIQLTGRNNYKFFGDLSGYNLIQDPDILISDRDISALVSIIFIKHGLGTKTSFSSQSEADRAVTQVIGGNGLNLNSGYGAELLSKVNVFSSKLSFT
jgi:putative chitinase